MNNDVTNKVDEMEESKDGSENQSKFTKFLVEWIFPIFLALIIAGLINKFLVFKVYIPSESMLPTLKVGDQLFVTKIYNTEKIERQEIVVFYSNELEDLLIKRVIGLPGDTVEIKDDGKVFVNGEELKEEYVKHQDNRRGKFQVPENKFFFLGDNRANSKDSRWWKDPYIDKSDIRGKAQVRVYPFDRIGMVR